METIIQFILSGLPWFWLAVMVVCVLIELFTMGLTTIWFALGALVMVFLSFTHIPFKWQLLIFAVISLVLLIYTRPLVLKKFNFKKAATNADRLIGRRALVVSPIKELEKGAVKIDGVEWSAASYDGSCIEAGTQCEIVSIEGVTVKVKAI